MTLVDPLRRHPLETRRRLPPLAPLSRSLGALSRSAAGILLVVAVTGAVPARAQVPVAVAQGRSWLVGRQRQDGGFGDVPELSPRDSAAAVEALLSSGGED